MLLYVVGRYRAASSALHMRTRRSWGVWEIRHQSLRSAPAAVRFQAEVQDWPWPHCAVLGAVHLAI